MSVQLLFDGAFKPSRPPGSGSRHAKKSRVRWRGKASVIHQVQASSSVRNSGEVEVCLCSGTVSVVFERGCLGIDGYDRSTVIPDCVQTGKVALSTVVSGCGRARH